MLFSKFAMRLISITLLGAILAGCGGGSVSPGSANQSSGGANHSDQPFQFGELSGRAAIDNPPLVSNGSGATVTALKGVVSSLLLNDPSPTLAETRIIFHSNRDGNFQIYAMNIDGTNQTRITNDTAQDVQPVVSPDGALIAFVSNRSGHNDIWLMGVNGNSLTQLTNDAADDQWPTFSPDGIRIAFQSKQPGSNYYQIYVMNRNGTNVQRLTNDASNDTQPTWSPDGSKIAFVSDRNGIAEIFVMSATGASPTHLTDNSAAAFDPAWKPDGTEITFTSGRSTNTQIYVMNADGTNQLNWSNNKFNDKQCTWSPDGSKVVFASDQDGNEEIYTSGGRVRLTNNLAYDGRPVYAPFVRQRLLLGPGGSLGSSSAGFLFGQQGNTISSIVAFDATTRTSVLITNQTGLNNTGPNLIYSLDADSLTSLAFVQNPAYSRTAIIGPGSNLTSASGALISFNATTGGVAAVLPFTGTRAAGIGKPTASVEGGQRILRGQFLGAWDGTGKNLAPNGANEIALNAKTGAVLSTK